jgi:TolB protein
VRDLSPRNATWISGSRLRLGALAAGLVLAISPGPTLAAEAGARGAETIRVSVGSGGVQANGTSGAPSVSASGRYVAFSSRASNLVAADTNPRRDIFLRDAVTETTQLVSRGLDGVEANGHSFGPSISADGTVVAFISEAANLVEGDSNGLADVFVRNLRTGQTLRISVSSAGNEANDASSDPSTSASGRFVAFLSDASNLVGRDEAWGGDVFVHDLRTGDTRQVTIGVNGIDLKRGSYPPSISAHGRFVAFASGSPRLIEADANRANDVFVRDLKRKRTRRVSLSSGEDEANDSSFAPTIAGDGRRVAFHSSASNLVPRNTKSRPHIFVRDLDASRTRRVSLASGGAAANRAGQRPSISASGRYVAFVSRATNLARRDATRDRDVFVHDLSTRSTRWVSVGSNEMGRNTESLAASISAHGRFVGFRSSASNLVPGDTNGVADVFVRGPLRWGSR